MPKYIIEDIEISFDESDKQNFEEENFDEQNSNTENSDEENYCYKVTRHITVGDEPDEK